MSVWAAIVTTRFEGQKASLRHCNYNVQGFFLKLYSYSAWKQIPRPYEFPKAQHHDKEECKWTPHKSAAPFCSPLVFIRHPF